MDLIIIANIVFWGCGIGFLFTMRLRAAEHEIQAVLADVLGPAHSREDHTSDTEKV